MSADRSRRRRGAAVAAGIIAAALMFLHLLGGGIQTLDNLEAQALTLRFWARGPRAPGPETAVLLVDDRSIAELGGWPLSRSRFADAVRQLAADGARVIVFNLLFTDRTQALPAALAEPLRRLRERLGEDAADAELAALLDRALAADRTDRDFARAVAEAGNVVVPFAFVSDRQQARRAGVPPEIERSAIAVYRVQDGRPPPLPPGPQGLLSPLPELARAAAAAGHATLVFDPDGAPRHEYLVMGFGGDLYPSLPLAALRLFDGVPRDELAVLFPDTIALGERRIRTERPMRIAVNYHGPPGTFPTYGLSDLLAGRVPAGAFAGRIVIIGGTAAGVADSVPSPFTTSLPGAERYASIVDNLLHGEHLRRGPWVLAVELAAIALAAFLAFVLTSRLSMPAALGAGLLLLGGWAAANHAAFALRAVWIDFIIPALSLVLTLVLLTAMRVIEEERRRRAAERQRANLGRYFSPNVVERLAASDAPFAFDRTIEAAILFVDIVGFTRLAERLAPAEAIALLRDFHARVEAAVFAHDGTLDKFLGDGAMASFGPPSPDPRDARNALAAARDIAAAVADDPRLRIGIGVHWGPVLMGDVGGARRFEFTVIGDTVNVASRLESLTRELGVTIAVSDAAMRAARAGDGADPVLDAFRRLPDQPIRGRDAPIGLWGWPADAVARLPASAAR